MKTRIGKRRTGCLFRHGAGYAVSWTVNGKRMFQSLRDAKGNPITEKTAAETARAELMAPFRAADEKAVLENLTGKLSAVTAEVERLEDERADALRIADAWTAFAKSPRRPDCGQVTLDGYEGQWNRFVDFMDKRSKGAALRDVDDATAEAYATDLTATGMTPNTFNKHLAVLALVFRVLGRTPAYHVTVNPWGKDSIQRKRLAPHSHRELTIEELRQVCSTAKGELRTLFAIGLYSGLRLADAVTLQWGEVDLTRRLIMRVPRKTARRTGKAVQIPIHTALGLLLAETPPKKRHGPVLPELCAKYNLGRDRVSKIIQDHFRACKIETAAPSESAKAPVDVGFHSLRHTLVSLCRQAGTPLSVVEALVGHSSAAMTQHYTHVGEDATRHAIGALPQITGGKGNKKREAAARVARLLAKVKKAKTEEVKRTVLRFLLARAKALKRAQKTIAAG